LLIGDALENGIVILDKLLNLAWLVLTLSLWGFVHSWLASSAAKRLFREWWGVQSFRFYRFGYNVFAVVSFLPILWLTAALPDQRLYVIPFPWLILTTIGQILAVIFLRVGVQQTGAQEFVGLRQLTSPEDKQVPRLVTEGLYRWVRHPLYTAGLLFIWLTPIMTFNLMVLGLALTIYILVGAYFEERKLSREYGAQYAQYKASTPMLVPGLRSGRNK
jgi:protein-S-isoprenylcysteine O-methyltransferase Ste14